MDAIIATIVLLLPGFIASAILGYLLIRRPGGQFDRTAECLALAFSVYGVTTLVPGLFDVSAYAQRLFDSSGRVMIPRLFTVTFLRDLGFLVLLASAIAVLMGFALRCSPVRKRWVRLFGRNYYSRVWDSVFDRNTDELVVQADMEDGRVWIGTVLEASDTTGEREVLLGDPAEWKNGRILPSDASMLLIDGKAIQRLFLIPRERYMNQKSLPTELDA